MEYGAEMLCSTSVGQHPWTGDQRRLVTNMLVVATFQLGDPVVLLIAMVADDPPRDTTSVIHGRLA